VGEHEPYDNVQKLVDKTGKTITEKASGNHSIEM
jgi:hypothetical protein